MVNNAINYIKSEQMLRTVAIGAVAKRFGSNAHPVDGHNTYKDCVTEECGARILWFNYDAPKLGVMNTTGCIEL